ncbi:MAG TPA: hypothetical protein VFS30_04945 [Dehalococcoidia bacterium]|nr:hypothetical protein [Dehalococcoidia bacterium]
MASHRIDVVGAWRPVLEDRLLEAVLLADRTLGQGEIAVKHVAGGTIDLR